MKKNIADRWCAALRSGTYRQGTGSYHNPVNNSYCVLGVLIDIAAKDPEFADCADTNEMLMPEALPLRVRAWAGLASAYCADCSSENALITLNDDEKKSFAEIADYIEQAWTHL